MEISHGFSSRSYNYCVYPIVMFFCLPMGQEWSVVARTLSDSAPPGPRPSCDHEPSRLHPLPWETNSWESEYFPSDKIILQQWLSSIHPNHRATWCLIQMIIHTMPLHDIFAWVSVSWASGRLIRVHDPIQEDVLFSTTAAAAIGKTWECPSFRPLTIYLSEEKLR